MTTSISRTYATVTKWVLIGISVTFLSIVMVLPLGVIFWEAFSQGQATFWAAWALEETLLSTKLSLYAILFSVVINGIFGIAAAWYLTRYAIKGKQLLISLIELPFSISPVISGMLMILMFGAHSFIGKGLIGLGFPVLFTPIAIVLATLFVTLPYTAKEMIMLMQTQGQEEEEAAYLLGARGFHIFLKVTLPNLLPALLYGCLLTAARALGEFGAVSVVSGHIRGYTTTLPLHIEILYNDYKFTEAFAISTMMMCIAVFSVGVRSVLDWRHHRRIGGQK